MAPSSTLDNNHLPPQDRDALSDDVDKGNLDSSIDAIQHVLDNNHLPPQDRDALSDDVTQLRRMRDAYDRHEIGY